MSHINVCLTLLKQLKVMKKYESSQNLMPLTLKTKKMVQLFAHQKFWKISTPFRDNLQFWVKLWDKFQDDFGDLSCIHHVFYIRFFHPLRSLWDSLVFLCNFEF